MILIVDKEYSSNNFIAFLISRIKSTIAYSLNLNKLKVFDEYFKSEQFKNILNKDDANENISAKKVIILAMNNIRSLKRHDDTLIFIDDNVYYPKTSIKLIDLCKLINYGSMSAPAYPIFSDVFEHFSKDLPKFREKYFNSMM